MYKRQARDFIEVIESDEALSARVIKIANSVFFDRGTPSKTIEESVNVIGINELRCLLGATTLSEIFPSKFAARSLLWANDIATALIARTLGAQLAPGKEDLLFLGGLMHDIGKLVLLQRRSEDYHLILNSIENEDIDFCTAESRLFAFDHTEVGLLVGERWRFSPELNQMIRQHHDSWESLVSSGVSLAAIIKGADTIAHALALGHGRSLGRIQRAAELALDNTWSALGLAESDRPTLLSSAQRTFESEYDLYLGNR